MADVSLYVAIVTAGAGIVGAAIPQVTTVIRDTRQAERDRRERLAQALRDVCVDLLRAAGELRTLTENIASYRGDPNGMRALVADVRDHAGATRLNAARVGLEAPAQLAERAYQVATAASNLVGDVERSIDVDRGVDRGAEIRDASVKALISSIAAFQEAARDIRRG
jgi:hypothetical protein